MNLTDTDISTDPKSQRHLERTTLGENPSQKGKILIL